LARRLLQLSLKSANLTANLMQKCRKSTRKIGRTCCESNKSVSTP
jgi:hypothetical protein